MVRANIAVLGILSALLGLPWAATAAQPGSDAITVRANPDRICIDERNPSYLNFDLILQNRTDKEAKVAEVRGLVLDAEGEVVERRLLWQQSLALLTPDKVIPAKGEAMLFNPLVFNSLRARRTIRFEVDLADQPAGTSPLLLTVSPELCHNRTKFVLPLKGRILVYDGHDLFSHHRRGTYGDDWSKSNGVTDNFQRFGLDLVVVDEQGRLFRGAGNRTSDWLGWGQPVRASADGIVTALHNAQPDNVVIGTVDKWTTPITASNPMSSYGNYVLIDHGDGEFTIAAHLKAGSVRVRKGQRVKSGEPVGEVGNSGASGGVHVHFERRTGWGIAGMKTLPPYFHDITVIGTGEQPRGGKGVAVNSGDILSAR